MNNELPRFSFSDIRTFQECPFQLRERKAKRFVEEPTEALLVGSYAHAMLEGQDSANKFITENMMHMLGNVGKKNESIKKVYRDIVLVVDQVKKSSVYRELNLEECKQELYLRAAYQDFVISGRLDVVKFDHENKVIEIIDWKTAADFEDKFDNNLRAYLDWYSHYREQLALYAWLISENYEEYALAGYTITGRIVGFTKKLPVNIKSVAMNFGKLSEVEDKVLVQTVLAELDNIAHSIDHEAMDGYYCHNCACCVQNKKYEELEIETW